MIRSRHFLDMLIERNITEQWVNLAENNPDSIEDHEDGTRHYIKKIPDNDNRWLRVIVNVISEPNKEVTVFFDRRLKKLNESKS